MRDEVIGFSEVDQRYGRLAEARIGLPAGSGLVGEESLEDTRERVESLVGLASRGLRRSFLPGTLEFPQTVRALLGPDGVTVGPEGRSDRYTAIAALGIARLPVPLQRDILQGRTADDLVEALVSRSERAADLGAVALAAWAAGEVLGTFPSGLIHRLAQAVASGRPLSTVEASWAVTAAVACAQFGATDSLRDGALRMLLQDQGEQGLFPHSVGGRLEARWRAHVGSFADQVYPLQACARVARTGNDEAAAAAVRTASRLCALQGEAGQWWWHYDSRTGDVVERFPVYSVHQHAMAPMVLRDLDEAVGTDHRVAVRSGLGWLHRHPEVVEELVSVPHDLIWRKVGRREPRKVARGLAAATTAVHSGLRPPALDRCFPPTSVDYECRPYELGWLLYAWLEPRVPTNGGYGGDGIR